MNTILIVDDTPTNLDVISETLNDAGFKIAIATSGERALQQIDRRPPDLILLDVMMPGMDGFETCRRLKELPAHREIPVIFMTALSDTDSKVQALELGAVDYITKPFQEREVLARVKTHLQLSQLTQDLATQVTEKATELQASQLQLIQHEKMSALGQLVAGVAHEINNPLGCVSTNIFNAQRGLQELIEHLHLYQSHASSEEIEAHAEEIDLEFLLVDLPKILGAMQVGCDRIESLSTSLRTFSRSDSDRPVLFNLHEGLDSTLLILKHRLKTTQHRPEIQVIRNYGDIPQVSCYAGQLNQVFMNILANAIDAIEAREDVATDPNQIEIQTNLNGELIEIRIKDNGIGMSETVKQKVFEHLFTTKSVGKGTGLGMTIAHQIIVEKHQGSIKINSIPEKGTEFILTIPIALN
ncbi:two-component hybrid sensor and regulator [Leptolyngbya sp. NIES-3755]|nr:two-component hybrid sensor and regulator [Leptolyngbya sp. NIES-3755]